MIENIICSSDYDWEHFNWYQHNNKYYVSSITMTVVSITKTINYDNYENYEEFLLLLCIISAKKLDKSINFQSVLYKNSIRL